MTHASKTPTRMPHRDRNTGPQQRAYARIGIAEVPLAGLEKDLEILSWLPHMLWLAIHCRLHHGHLLGKSLETFRVSNKEIATGSEYREDPSHDLALRLRVEINHHVPQEHHVKFPDSRQSCIQVNWLKLHALPQCFLDEKRPRLAADAFQAIGCQIALWNLRRTLESVMPGARLC